MLKWLRSILCICLFLVGCGTVNPAVPRYPSMLDPQVDLAQISTSLQPSSVYKKVVQQTVFTTTDAVEHVLQWYEQALKDQGWSNVQRSQPTILGADSYKNCDHMYVVSIEAQTVDNLTFVHVLHEKDVCR